MGNREGVTGGGGNGGGGDGEPKEPDRFAGGRFPEFDFVDLNAQEGHFR